MDRRKSVTLGVGVLLAGFLLALPFRRHVTIDMPAANNTELTSADLRLQVPGDSEPSPAEKIYDQVIPDNVAITEPAAPSAVLHPPRLLEHLVPPIMPESYRATLSPENERQVTPVATSQGPPVGPATTSPAAPIRPPHRGIRTHRLRDGDSLESLAVRYLGDARRAGEIMAANAGVLRDAQLLPIGVVIRIPPMERRVAPTPPPVQRWQPLEE